MRRHPGKLISRRNWRDTRAYLTYCEEVRQNTRGSLALYRVAVDHVLRWSTDILLPSAPQIRPVFPQFLDDDLSVSYLKRLCQVARRFFLWSKRRWPERYAEIDEDWVETLRPAKHAGSVRQHQYYTLAEVEELAIGPCATLTELRDRAAVAFLFLSGMRARAFCTLPLEAVDLTIQTGQVKQWPSLGVQTKNRVTATTYLLGTPEVQPLRDVVAGWHARIARELEGGMWYSLIAPDQVSFLPVQSPGRSRQTNLARRVRRLCEVADVAYRSPHKLRNAHIVFALEHCHSMADFKAVSQNVMHEQLTTTDAIYSQLTNDDVASRIAGLGQGLDDDARIAELVRDLFRKEVGRMR